MMYDYTESVRNHGYKISLIGFAIAVICLALVFIVNSSEGVVPFKYLFMVVLCLMCIPGIIMLITGVRQIISGGQFEISVSSKELVWSQPDYLGPSFRSDLAQIDFIKKVIKIKKSGEMKFKYFIVSNNAEDFRLNKQSSVSIDEVVESLVSNGVEIREEEVTS